MTASQPTPARGEALFRPGVPVIVRRSERGRRKTSYNLLVVRQNETWVLVDTHLASRIVFGWLKEKKFPELAEYDQVTKEVRWGKSRFDFHLSGRGGEAYLEVKSVSLAEGGVARFPDGVTERGRRHVEELSRMVGRGLKAFILFLVERDDVSEFTANFGVDPQFSASLLRAIARGVVPLCYRLVFQPEGVCLGGKVPIFTRQGNSRLNEGCYQLVIEVREAIRLAHPRFSDVDFPAGFYIYTGSAKRNLLHRVARHLSEKQKNRWHIDYLLSSREARIQDVIFLPGRDQRECAANLEVGRMKGAAVIWKGFGSSACRCGCPAHLYWFERLPRYLMRRLAGCRWSRGV